MGKYSFSVRNKLRESVQNVVCLVVFYDRAGLPIDTEMTLIRGPIGGNLAKRSSKLGRISADEVRNLTSKTEVRIYNQGPLGFTRLMIFCFRLHILKYFLPGLIGHPHTHPALKPEFQYSFQRLFERKKKAAAKEEA